MNTGVPKRSILIKGRKTSVSLEDAFWRDLRAIARSRQLSVSSLVNQVEASRVSRCNLSSALRVFVLDHYRSQCSASSRGERDVSAQVEHGVAVAAAG